MINTTLIGLVIAALVVIYIVTRAVRVITEYERAVVFRLGRIQEAKGPGIIIVAPIVDKVNKIDLRTHTYDIPPQDLITKDNVTVQVNAVTYYNVVDPVRSVLSIENYQVGTQQVAQTTLRSIIGQTTLDDLLTKREEINSKLQQIIDEVTNPWGIKVTIVEVKDVMLPESMRRAMARQAESERDRRAKVIHAIGEQEAAENLARAAEVMEAHPAAMHLRTLSSMLELGAEQNSTVVFPLPMELLRLFDAAGTALGGQSGTAKGDAPAGSTAAPAAGGPTSGGPAADDPAARPAAQGATTHHGAWSDDGHEAPPQGDHPGPVGHESGDRE
ncbi:slipin family protein [Janibacter cremeus]|uniref:Regulator of protease activity HflC (Stomatin/prohibitin superfamily) n=1 Tax=Janibacter cremeus TaxID=1285192 RepID=A0A852VN18_9MICO|nr:slipin family protein [Janibacter cremeus]NYF97329.1 regulator of protease activity HflC (stomatin/prohibitin superfamily) [Janibacter cremeus]